ncbi:hypothetical protein L484_021669 [Morus notabilis]|uniref:Uncharacterized protein n=1 Tax=Morus notabilis TaxID=981085 RepID=W9S6N3_9ROSA|nr:hypothetical protein L484_021669 [Morus notabilis]
MAAALPVWTMAMGGDVGSGPRRWKGMVAGLPVLSSSGTLRERVYEYIWTAAALPVRTAATRRDTGSGRR